MARFAINGFGRIGRNILRAAIKRGVKDFDVVLINDVDKPKTLAHLFKYDSVHGVFDGTVEATEDAVVINGKRIAVSAKRDPGELAHKEHKVEIALECSGRFTEREDAAKHLTAGAKKVIISAPGKGQDFTMCFGSTTRSTTRRSTTSSPTRRAPPTASRRWPRSCWRISASSAA